MDGIVIKQVAANRWRIFGVELYHEGRFREGTSDELISTADDIKTIASNFARLRRGPRPLFVPPVGVGHDSEEGRAALAGVDINPKFGDVLACYPIQKDTPEGRLYFLDGILEINNADVVQWIRDGNLSEVSAEITEYTPENCPTTGQHLYRVALLGYQPPGLKLLRGLQLAEPSTTHAFGNRTKAIRHRGRITVFNDCRNARRFSGANAMQTREEALAALTAAGIDTAGFEALSDQQCCELAKRIATTPTPTPDPDAEQMRNQVRQFADQHRTLTNTVTTLQRQLAEVQQRQTTNDVNARTLQQQQITRNVHVFCDDMARQGRLTPAENGDEAKPGPVRLRLLRAADDTRVHTFGDRQQTELDAQMEEIRSRTPHTLRERIPSGNGGKQPEPAKDPLDVKAEAMLAKKFKIAPATAAATN
jgi:hypothetical protein